MHYRHNHLTKVVIRLDFGAVATLRQTVQLELKPEFSARIADPYPIVVGQPTAKLSVNIGPGGSGINQEMTGIQWFHRKTENSTCVVVLDPEFVAIEYGKDAYEHFPLFRSEVELVVTAMRELYDVSVFTRIGLRYINEIVMPQGNPLNWDGLIAPSLVTSTMAGQQADAEMVRSMHQITTRRNESDMAFNYGLNNPDFPNALARRAFVLDYDCARLGVEANQAMQAITQLNQFCEIMFESSIGDGLRQQMEIIND